MKDGRTFVSVVLVSTTDPEGCGILVHKESYAKLISDSGNYVLEFAPTDLRATAAGPHDMDPGHANEN